MDPESQRALIIVLIAGCAVMAICTVALVFVFRAFGGAKPASASHVGLMAALIAFVFACCAGLLLLSYSGR
jgi:hypothetical protein